MPACVVEVVDRQVLVDHQAVVLRRPTEDHLLHQCTRAGSERSPGSRDSLFEVLEPLLEPRRVTSEVVSPRSLCEYSYAIRTRVKRPLLTCLAACGRT